MKSVSNRVRTRVDDQMWERVRVPVDRVWVPVDRVLVIGWSRRNQVVEHLRDQVREDLS